MPLGVAAFPAHDFMDNWRPGGTKSGKPFTNSRLTFNIANQSFYFGKVGVTSFTNIHFKTRIVDLDDCLGCYNSAEQTLSVSPVAVGENSVLLHEMIHLHESVINELPLHYHDMLLWSLYQDLREKIKGLDDAINQHAHILNEHTIYSQGGLHDILFLLKSFDLDIRYQCPLGTVFGYGRIDDFKYLQYD